MFKWGEKVEVKDSKSYPWADGIFIGINPLSDGYVTVSLDGDYIYSWKYCRKLRPDLKVDDRVLVRAGEPGTWFHAHFKRWSDTGYIVCFNGGETSWTSNGEEICWKEWKLPCD